MAISFASYLVGHDPLGITPPVGTADGDLCIVVVISGNASAAGPPSGFTLLDTLTQGGFVKMSVGYKYLASGEGSSLTLPGDDTFNQARYGLWFYDSAASVGEHAINSDQNGSGDSVMTIPSIDALSGSEVIAAAGGRDPGTIWTSYPGDFVVDWDVSTGQASAFGAHYTATGTTGTKNVTNTSASFQHWITTSIEVIPGGSDPIPSGDATGTFSFAGSSVGKFVPKGSSWGDWAFAGAADGSETPEDNSGTAAGSFNFAGSAVGQMNPKAIAGGNFSFSGSAVGKRVPAANGSGDFQFSGSAVGTRNPKATASGQFNFSGTANGTGGGPPIQIGGVGNMYWYYYWDDKA